MSSPELCGLGGPPDVAARTLLGAVLHGRGVSVRIVETEAYAGADDPASHAARGMTRRNTVMFGPAGYLYAYFIYGMHTCLNVSAGVEGVGSAVLLRAGEVISGDEVARERRPAARRAADLGRGPGNLARVLGATVGDDGLDLGGPDSPLRLESGPCPPSVTTGPRVGVSTAADVPWRFWITGSSAVSAYRRSPPRATRTTSGP